MCYQNAQSPAELLEFDGAVLPFIRDTQAGFRGWRCGWLCGLYADCLLTPSASTVIQTIYLPVQMSSTMILQSGRMAFFTQRSSFHIKLFLHVQENIGVHHLFSSFYFFLCMVIKCGRIYMQTHNHDTKKKCSLLSISER